MSLRQRPGDQPLPKANRGPSIHKMVIADIEARMELGISRYGVALQAHNGRDVLQDIYEEILDAAVYIKTEMVQRSMSKEEYEALDDD